MSGLMWSDPQPFQGRGPSKRGIGLSFGPDITKTFLEQNNLGKFRRGAGFRVSSPPLLTLLA
jgi:hypothetical protein